MRFDPGQLARWCGGRWTAEPTAAIRGFSIDSRRVAPGDCFVALRTGRRDGHDFVAEAFARGAAASLVDHAVEGAGAQLVVADTEAGLLALGRGHRQSFAGPVIGVTGSAGKTSTKDLLRRLLGAEETCATEGNLNNTLGVPLSLLRLDPTRHRFAVIEAGINLPGEMARLAPAIAPTHAIVTMVGLAHAEGLGGPDGVAREKAVLPAAVGAEGLVLFPADCLRHAPFRALRAPRLVAVEGGAEEAGEDRIAFQTTRSTATEARLNVRQGQTETVLEITEDSDPSQLMEWSRRPECMLTICQPALPPFSLSIPAMSPGMTCNLVLALALARALGVPAETLATRLEGWAPSPQRGEIVAAGARVYYVDCYNANPGAMIDALTFFAARFAGVAKRYVLGSMRELGPYAEAEHARVGAALRLEGGDAALFLGEWAETLRAGAVAGGQDPARLEVVPTVEAARAALGGFRGAVFLKGSRAYGLERLVPGREGAGETEAIAC